MWCRRDDGVEEGVEDGEFGMDSIACDAVVPTVRHDTNQKPRKKNPRIYVPKQRVVDREASIDLPGRPPP